MQAEGRCAGAGRADSRANCQTRRRAGGRVAVPTGGGAEGLGGERRAPRAAGGDRALSQRVLSSHGLGLLPGARGGQARMSISAGSCGGGRGCLGQTPQELPRAESVLNLRRVALQLGLLRVSRGRVGVRWHCGMRPWGTFFCSWRNRPPRQWVGLEGGSLGSW